MFILNRGWHFNTWTWPPIWSGRPRKGDGIWLN